MYSKFNYIISDKFYNNTLKEYYTEGENFLKKQKQEFKNSFYKYITPDGIINGSALKNFWFEITNKEIFISHSHKDIDKAIALAGWIYKTFKLECFIDSCSWGYCDELLKELDDNYCYDDDSKTYNYKSRNYTTSHVHMMLSTALSNMMNKTECIIFLNTSNSINITDEINEIQKSEYTFSPWIYYELSMMTLIKSTLPSKIISEHSAYSDINIKYDVSKILNELTRIDDDTMRIWETNWNKRTIKSKEALDVLYETIYPKSQK